MANPEHLEILKNGHKHWNQWRNNTRGTLPDLSNADLRGADLSGADLRVTNLRGANLSSVNLSDANLNITDLSGANLRGADLRDAKLRSSNFIGADLFAEIRDDTFLIVSKLRGADLRGANLAGADLRIVDLRGANLSGAYLGGTNLSNADLSNADLSGANLSGANFSDANLAGANLSSVILWKTVFGSTNLSKAKCLGECIHEGPSIIDQLTLVKSGKLPEVFLRGCGLSDDFIAQIPFLFWEKQAFEFYSCFISYSSKDEDFARRLHTDLQNEGVRCWFAPEDMKIGDKIRQRIDESIRIYDKLLLILSENSINSKWVEKEVETAFDKETLTHTVLFPIRLDNAVMETDMVWGKDIRRTRHIGNFTNWKDHDTYQAGFKRLLRDLRGEGKMDG